MYFGASACKYHLAFHVLGVSCFTGMSYLVKKLELDRLNGLGWFGRYLAEDFFIAQMLRDRCVIHMLTSVYVISSFQPFMPPGGVGAQLLMLLFEP